MVIKINDKPADITLEGEKTVVEVLAGIQQWLESSEGAGGFYVSGVEIDGKSYGSLSLDEALQLPLDGISSINVITSGWAELLIEALTVIKGGLEKYGTLSADEQKNYRENWEKTTPALFLKEHDKDIYAAVLKTLKEQVIKEKLEEGRPFSVSAAITLLSERIREIEDPWREMAALKPLAEEVAGGLEDLPLDMQTGKDGKAAQTITVFSSLVEKIFRLVFLFRYFKADIDTIEVASMNGPEKLSLKDYIGEFSTALKEMISAYENKDTVLVGDLAEYELAPRLRCLTTVLSECKAGKKA